jgi:hypothetical protein
MTTAFTKNVFTKTALAEAMTSGVLVEVLDESGNTLGQAIYADWQQRPLPAVGDRMHCAVNCTASGRRLKLAGRVVARQFELQHDDDMPCVWVRLVVEATQSRPRRSAIGKNVGFSDN